MQPFLLGQRSAGCVPVPWSSRTGAVPGPRCLAEQWGGWGKTREDSATLPAVLATQSKLTWKDWLSQRWPWPGHSGSQDSSTEVGTSLR